MLASTNYMLLPYLPFVHGGNIKNNLLKSQDVREHTPYNVRAGQIQLFAELLILLKWEKHTLSEHTIVKGCAPLTYSSVSWKNRLIFMLISVQGKCGSNESTSCYPFSFRDLSIFVH